MPNHYERGDYSATVLRQGFAESKEKGTPFFFLEFEPIQALGANVLPAEIYPRTIRMYLTEAAAPYAFDKLKALGWSGARLSDLDPDNPNHHSFHNQIITVRNEPDGEYDKFDLIREAGGAGGAEHTAGIAAKLDRLYAKTLAAHGNGDKPKRAKKAPMPTQQPAGIPDADIPF